MSDPTLFVTLASTFIVALAMASTACLRAWHEWLDLRRLQLEDPNFVRKSEPLGLNELRARVRRLETIANGTSA